MRFAGMRFSALSVIYAVPLAALVACGGSSTDVTPTPVTPTTPTTPTVTPAIAIALSASTLSVQAGASGAVTVTLTRSGGFTGDVTLAVEGLPTGSTAANATIASGATSATLNIAAGATAAASTGSVTIRATGTGVTAVTGSVALTVTAATPAAGSFTLTAAPTTVTLAQGATSTVTLTIGRTGSFTGAVNLAVAGAPTGLTAALSSASVTGTSATLTLTAASTLAAGAQTLTITGSGTGASNVVVTVPVTVTATTTNPGSGSIAWTFCGRTGIPIWVAVQDGTGAFARVTGTNDVYSFNITSGRGGVAYVFPIAGGGFDSEVFYGNTAEITAQGATQCTAAGAGKSVTAAISNATSSDIILASLSSGVTAVASGNASATITGVPNGNLDLVASKSAFVLNGSSITQTLSKVLIRRNINPAAGSALAAIDFNGSESFAPVSKNVTINNLGGEVSIVNSLYTTTNSPYAVVLASDISPTTGSARTYYGVPAANQVSGDLHGLSIVAIPSLTTTNSTRQAILFFKDAVDKQVTLGPALTTPTVTALAAAGYGRLRCAIAVQPEYNKYFTCQGTQTVTGANQRNSVVTQTSNYATGSTLNIDFPDLSGVSGFDVTWGLKTGVSTTWSVTATSFTGNVLPAGTQYTEGLSVLSGTKQGTVTP